jgi:hypothetical protein
MTWLLLGIYSCCCGGDLFPFVARLGAKNRPVSLALIGQDRDFSKSTLNTMGHVVEFIDLDLE